MIKPVLHRILIKPDDILDDPAFKKARQAGLVFAGGEEYKMEQNRMDTGTVLEVGPSAFRAFMSEAGITECPVKPGDRVSFAKYSGKTIMQKEERYIVLNDEDIVAIIGDKDE